MNMVQNLCCAAGVAALFLAPSAFAAAPDDVSVDAIVPEAAVAPPVASYALETEMVVHDWVLCVSQSVAEELAHAREEGIEAARAAYATLSSARSCGLFPELHVILREPVYASAAESGADARVFGALVNLSGDWASAFVVSGGLPSE